MKQHRQDMQKSTNEPLSSLTHLIGLLLSVAGLVLLIVFAAIHRNALGLVAFSIFGMSLILLYLFSSIYHFIPSLSRAKEVFRRIDQSMVFILIAGTYTAVCLTVLRGWWRWSLLGAIWAFAIVGVSLASAMRMRTWLSTPIYLTMGWLGVIAIFPLTHILSPKGMWWLVAGGVFYTIGAAFYGLDSFVPRTRWFGMHEVFHVFVIAGSFSHFWLMLNYVL